jgi:uncharacterized membrane protein (DUF106 family)
MVSVLASALQLYNNHIVGVMVSVLASNVIVGVMVSVLASNVIVGVVVSVLASNVVDRRYEPREVQTKGYENGICCFSAKHAALRRKSKD